METEQRETQQRKAEGKRGKQPQQEAKKKKNTGHNPLECPVCLETFDHAERRPRTLPCGHTVCTLCTQQLVREGQVTCPECRAIHAVPEGGLFAVCYALENMMMIRDEEAGTSAAANAGKDKESTKAWLCLPIITQSFLQEQETQVLAAITTCREVQSQLDQYQTTLAGWCEKQQLLENRLQEVIDQSSSARELVHQEESRAVVMKEEAKEGEQQLQAVLDTLQTVTSIQEAGVVVNEAFDSTDKAEQVKEECQEGFPDVAIVNTVRKVTEDCRAALEAIQSVQAARETQAAVATAPGPSGQTDQHSTVTDRLQAILAPAMTTEDLRSLTQPTKTLLSNGQVFAVHWVQRHANISLEGDQQYLHTLKERPLPPGATTLQARPASTQEGSGAPAAESKTAPPAERAESRPADNSKSGRVTTATELRPTPAAGRSQQRSPPADIKGGPGSAASQSGEALRTRNTFSLPIPGEALRTQELPLPSGEALSPWGLSPLPLSGEARRTRVHSLTPPPSLSACLSPSPGSGSSRESPRMPELQQLRKWLAVPPPISPLPSPPRHLGQRTGGDKCTTPPCSSLAGVLASPGGRPPTPGRFLASFRRGLQHTRPGTTTPPPSPSASGILGACPPTPVRSLFLPPPPPRASDEPLTIWRHPASTTGPEASSYSRRT